jgi:hypothetical protein
MTKVAWQDESGNMGFDFTKPGTSAHFMITLLITEARGKRDIHIAPDTHILYASMVNMLLNRLFIEGILNPDEALELIPSKMETSRNQNEQFASFVMTGTKTDNLTVNPTKSSDDKGLQAVDFISWALYRKYEYGNSDCAEILGDRVIREYDYLQGLVSLHK